MWMESRNPGSLKGKRLTSNDLCPHGNVINQSLFCCSFCSIHPYKNLYLFREPASKLVKLMGTSAESLCCKAFASPYWKEPEILTFWL